MSKVSSKTKNVISFQTGPWTSSALVGHEDEYNFLYNSLKNNSLHHAILLCGAFGVGKSSLIYRVLRDFCKDFADSSSDGIRDTAGMLMSGAHPDVFIVSNKDNVESDLIDIDSVRKIINFVVLKPSILPFKCVIIDSLDAMNVNSANALLKILEEPNGHTIFLMSCHNIRNVPQTIVSRCFKMYVKNLQPAEFNLVMNNINDMFALNMDAELQNALGLISSFSPGFAINLYNNNGLDFYKAMLQDFVSGGNSSFDYVNNNSFFIDMIAFFYTRSLMCISQMAAGSIDSDKYVDFEIEYFEKYINKYCPNYMSVINMLEDGLNLINLSRSFNLSSVHILNSLLSIVGFDSDYFHLAAGADYLTTL